MAEKSRYTAYAKALAKQEKSQSSPESILKKLKEYKEQLAVISVPVGESEDEQ